MTPRLREMRRNRIRRLRREAAGDCEAEIARIDALTATGRTNWFALLAYLVFAGITTLGVADADFFIESRQTRLPLVDVDIPTRSFFVFAPILGAALYVYLHLHVRKVTEALAEAEETADGRPLEESIRPWLLNDFVLRRRRDGAIRRRPLDGLAGLTTMLLIWYSGPLVLGLMWRWTWPAHELWLSSIGAVSVMACLLAGMHSWAKMERDLGRRGRWASWFATGLVVVLALPVGWLTLASTKGIWKSSDGSPEDRAAIQFENLNRQQPTRLPQRVVYLDHAWSIGGLARRVAATDVTVTERLSHWAWGILIDLEELDPPDLTAAQLSVLPPEHADLDTARHRYRTAFCERRGIGAEVCDRAPSADYDPPPHLKGKRTAWCKPRGYADDAKTDCTGFFARLDEEFAEEWEGYRTALIAAIAKPDFSGRDLRQASFAGAELSGIDFRGARMEGANLRGAQMEGADLREAQMEGAVLSEAQMEGAVLSEAQMEGADLRWAQMEGAVLREAQMEGAVLREAQMEGADLREARMEGADLRGAQMEGADLRGARMEGANLFEAQMEGADLSEARMEGAILRRADLRSAKWAGVSNRATPAHFADFRGGQDLTQARLSSMIGNGRTLLPDEPDKETGERLYIPDCWAEEPEGWATLVAALAPRGDGLDRFRGAMSEEEMRAAFLCAPGEVPQKTGTPWPLDELPPWESDPFWEPEARGPVK